MEKDRRREMGLSEVKPVTFGGYMFTPGPLVYENGQFRVQETWNETNSYGSKYGLTEGSTYFAPMTIGQRFDSRESNYDYNSGDIDNSNPLSFGDYDDWIVPTQDVFKTLIGVGSGMISRPGATVNGSTEKHYSLVSTNISYAGQRNIKGYLFFPDNYSIVGRTLSAFDSYTLAASGVSNDEINNFIKQGCMFFPFNGVRYNSSWQIRSGTYQSASKRNAGASGNLFYLSYNDSRVPSITDQTGWDVWRETILCRQVS